MPTKKKSPGYDSGGARLARKGRTAVLLGLEPDQVEAIDRARGFEPRTKFIIRAAMDAVSKVPEQSFK